jgi:hypothetical protein
MPSPGRSRLLVHDPRMRKSSDVTVGFSIRCDRRVRHPAVNRDSFDSCNYPSKLARRWVHNEATSGSEVQINGQRLGWPRTEKTGDKPAANRRIQDFRVSRDVRTLYPVASPHSPLLRHDFDESAIPICPFQSMPSPCSSGPCSSGPIQKNQGSPLASSE